MQHLCLETAEDGLNGLSGSLMRRSGSEECGYVLEPELGVCAFGASLVISHKLIRLATRKLQGVARSLIEGLKAFSIADVAAQEDLTGCVNNLIDVECRQLVPAVYIGAVEKIQTCTVTIPESIG